VVKGVYLNLVLSPHTWNNGMMEDWNVENPVFSGVDSKRRVFMFEY
jgi:hypothetical protein